MNEIEKARLDKGMSRSQVARKLEVTEGTVYSWERGNRNPSGANLIALSELFERDPSVFLSR